MQGDDLKQNHLETGLGWRPLTSLPSLCASSSHQGEGREPPRGVEGDPGPRKPRPHPPCPGNSFCNSFPPCRDSDPHFPDPATQTSSSPGSSIGADPVRTWACDPLVPPAQPQLQPLSLLGQRPPLTAPPQSGPVVHVPPGVPSWQTHAWASVLVFTAPHGQGWFPFFRSPLYSNSPLLLSQSHLYSNSPLLFS